MPDMDGYKLLEHVGLEMDLPIIMMFGDSTSVVMKGIRHRACDYLIKPVREEELRNIWQHVVRKILNENKEHDNSGSMEDIYWNKRGNDDIEYTSFVADPTEVVKAPKKRSSLKEEDIELESDDPTTSKKPRVMWSVELHQQFVSVVNQLGLDIVLQECPVGTYKNVTGSDKALCHDYPPHELLYRAIYIPVRGRCPSSKANCAGLQWPRG